MPKGTETYKIIVICTLTLLFSARHTSLLGQTQTSQEEALDRMVQRIIQDFIEFNEGDADFDFNTLYEDLLSLSADPMDINQATESELARLIFLSASDIQNIITYRSSLGDFVSVYELQAVPGLDDDQLQLLKRFVKISGGKIILDRSQPLQTSSYQDLFYLKWRYNIETDDNFISQGGNPPKFIGDKNSLYFRYQHSAPTERYGLIIEKDAGERWTTEGAELGLDYLSFHYQKSNVAPWLRQINLGEYNVSMGQGLIMHNGFGLGKSSSVTSIKKNRPGIRSYNSVTENLSLRGAALSLGGPNSRIKANVFASYAPRDANPGEPNDAGEDTFTSLGASGLHRTANEIEDIDNVYETTLGASIKLPKWKSLGISLNAISHSFDKSYETTLQPYQVYRWQGDNLSNVSLDYNAYAGGWAFFGEVARSSTGGYAHTHGILKSLDTKVDLALQYRSFDPEYQALYPNVFAENRLANNERGWYVGLTYRPHKQWIISTYADQWTHPWLRFRIDGVSQGQEYLLKVEYKKRRKWNYYLQYRYERKSENSVAETLIDYPVPRTIQRLRLNAIQQLPRGITLRSRLEFSNYDKEAEHYLGWLAYQDFIFKPLKKRYSISARIAYFDIPDFDARIYTYEQDLQLEYFIPAFTGQGLRYYARFRHDFSRRFRGEMRWEQTLHLVDDIGEGSLESTSRIKAQIRYRF